MRFYRFFSEQLNEKVKIGDEIELSKDELHHIKKVLRLEYGSNIEIFNGKGQLAKCILENKSAKIIEITSSESKNSSKINFFMSILKHGGNDDILRKVTEIGIQSITPVIAERSNSKWNEERAERIIIEALKQCGSLNKPVLNKPILFNEIKVDKADKSLILTIDESAKTISDLNLDKVTNINILIGPEGGFTEKELLIAKHKDFESFYLKTNILRAETAALYAISVIHSLICK